MCNRGRGKTTVERGEILAATTYNEQRLSHPPFKMFEVCESFILIGRSQRPPAIASRFSFILFFPSFTIRHLFLSPPPFFLTSPWKKHLCVCVAFELFIMSFSTLFLLSLTLFSPFWTITIRDRINFRNPPSPFKRQARHDFCFFKVTSSAAVWLQSFRFFKQQRINIKPLSNQT